MAVNNANHSQRKETFNRTQFFFLKVRTQNYRTGITCTWNDRIATYLQRPTTHWRASSRPAAPRPPAPAPPPFSSRRRPPPRRAWRPLVGGLRARGQWAPPTASCSARPRGGTGRGRRRRRSTAAGEPSRAWRQGHGRRHTHTGLVYKCLCQRVRPRLRERERDVLFIGPWNADVSFCEGTSPCQI